MDKKPYASSQPGAALPALLAAGRSPAELEANRLLDLCQLLTDLALPLADPEEFWPILADRLKDYFRCERISVFIQAQDGSLLSCLAQGMEAPIRLRMGAGVVGHVAQTRRIHVTNDPYQNAHFHPESDRSTGFKTHSILACPFIYAERVEGVVELVNKEGPFLDSDVAAMSRLAAQIAIIYAKLKLERDRRLVAERMAQLDKLAALGQLATGVAHEINNPLSAIKGYLTLIAEGVGADAQATADLKIVEDEVRRIEAIVRSLMSFARPSSAPAQPTDLREALEKALRLVRNDRRSKKARIETDWPLELPLVHGDAGQLEQVFLNLVINALHATQEKGEAARLQLRLRPERGGLRVEVQDNGSGIEPENLGRIFEPFFSTKKKGEGTGLGLYVVQGIVAKHGGRIWAESRPGEGTTFHLAFPAVQAEAGEA